MLNSDKEQLTSITTRRVVRAGIVQTDIGLYLHLVKLILDYYSAYDHNDAFIRQFSVNNLPSNCEFSQPRHLSQTIADQIDNLARYEKIVKFAITGIPGSGKTELAKQFALNYRTRLFLGQEDQQEQKQTKLIIWWLNATDEKTLFSDWQELAKKLFTDNEVSQRNKEDENAYRLRLIELVKQQLIQYPRWLLIFDDVQSLKQVANYLPNFENHRGIVLLTSQNATCVEHTVSLNQGLEHDEGIALVAQIAKVYYLGQSVPDSTVLVETMGNLPLAVSIATKHFVEVKQDHEALTVKEYMDQYILTTDQDRRTFTKLIFNDIAKLNQFYQRPQQAEIVFTACEKAYQSNCQNVQSVARAGIIFGASSGLMDGYALSMARGMSVLPSLSPPFLFFSPSKIPNPNIHTVELQEYLFAFLNCDGKPLNKDARFQLKKNASGLLVIKYDSNLFQLTESEIASVQNSLKKLGFIKDKDYSCARDTETKDSCKFLITFSKNTTEKIMLQWHASQEKVSDQKNSNKQAVRF